MTGPDGAQSALVMVDESGNPSWFCAARPALAAVSVDLAEGLSAIVDAATPDRVLSWTLNAGSDMAVLDDAFDDWPHTQSVAAAVAHPSEQAPLPAPTLAPAWARIAEIACVADLLPAGVEEDALDIDEAMARFAVGQLDAAARLFTVSYPMLVLVADRAVSGLLDDYTTERVRQMLHAATSVGLDEHAVEAIAPMLARLDAEHEVLQQDTDDALADWLTQLTSEQLVGAIDLTASAAADIDTGTAKIDLDVVAARILQWAGPDNDEVQYRFDRSTECLEVTVPLANGVEPLCSEVDNLMVYVADRTSGRVVVCLPTRVHDHRLHAAFPLPVWDPTRHVIGVFDSDHHIRDLHADELGRTLTQVRRLMVESWRLARQASDALSRVQLSNSADLTTTSQALHRRKLRRARTLATEAAGLVRGLITDTGTDPDIRDQLVAKAKAIESYLARLDPLDPRPATEPLLAEILEDQP